MMTTSYWYVENEKKKNIISYLSENLILIKKLMKD